MSVRRHAVTGGDSSNQCRQNSNLTRVEEVAHCQEGSPVAPLRAQLALEYRLQSLCQRLLESYKDQQDWAAVGQVAQSLVTNTQRVSLLKERLLSGNYTLDPTRQLQSTTEQPCAGGRNRLLSLISEADGDEEEGAEEAVEAGTESGSESSSVGKAFQNISNVLLHYQGRERSPEAAASPETSEGDASGTSSAVDYETASQQTSTSSEVEPDTSTTGLESLETRSNTGSEPSLFQLSASNTPSPEHHSSCSSGGIECSTPPLDIPQDLPPLVEEPVVSDADSGAVEEEAVQPDSPGEEEEGDTEEEGEAKGKDSVMETFNPEEAGVGSVDTNYVEMHPGVRTKEGVVVERGGEGEREEGEMGGLHGDSSDSGVEGTTFPTDLTTDLLTPVGRSHSDSCPVDSDPLPKDQSTPQSSTTSTHSHSLSPPLRPMSLSGSDSKLNISYSDIHHHFHSDNETMADDPIRGGHAIPMEHSSSTDNLDLSLPVHSGLNRKRQSTIPGFVSRQTKGLRKSTRKLVKRMGSISIRRSPRGSLDTAGGTLPVSIPTPIKGQDWDPTCLLEELYGDYRRISRSSTLDNARHSGYLEKLPVAQTKKTLLKGYKRRYFRAIEGNLYYYEDRLSERALGFLKLEDCKLMLIPEKLHLCLTQRNGTTLVMRASNHVELSDWHRALQLESVHPTALTIGSRIEESPLIIMDIGACSVRVGLAGEDAYPELFFPSVSSVDTTTGECNDCGLAALLPENRIGAKLVYPRRGTLQMSRNSMTANQAIVDIVDTVLNHYDLQSHQCGLLMTVPPTIPETERTELAEALLGTVFQFQSILFQEQALLSLYSYNTTTGIVVDIGDHIDIIPVIDGFAIEGGIHRLPFGGNAITEYLTKLITEKGIRYFSETETYINRYIKEDACFVSLNYVEDCQTCETKPALYTHQINVDRFQLPDHRKAIVIDDARFKATEGLFTPGLWGKDVTGLHDLVWKAIQACPIDQRRLLLRNIYLSGGTSLLPGLQERLKAEISTLAPSGNTVEVHASENRQHAAFLGGAVLAGLSSFSETVITQEEWESKGSDALKKWSS